LSKQNLVSPKNVVR